MGYEVIYLTGIAGVGKSTLTSQLQDRFAHVKIFEYGALLARAIAAKRGDEVQQRDLKEKSSALVTKQDVDDLDDWLVGEVERARKESPLIIDSHAVTMEQYGFRITPFSAEKIRLLNPTRIVLLTAPSAEVVRRVTAHNGGRPIPTLGQVERHSALQLAVAVTYSVVTGAPLYEVGNEDDSEHAITLISKWAS